MRRATARIYGAAPGDYGAGVTERVERGAWQARADLGLDYLDRVRHCLWQRHRRRGAMQTASPRV